MEFHSTPPPYLTSDKTSFAYISARDRWPVIITGAIDDTYRTISQGTDNSAKHDEGKAIIEELARLKYDLQHDRQMPPLNYDGEADVALYNEDLEKLENPTWFNVPWLYKPSDNLTYQLKTERVRDRRIHTLFKQSTHWKSYDVFARQKIKTFRSSRPAVVELAARYRTLVNQMKADESRTDSQNDEAERLLFFEMCEICLWGNATDLSLLTSLTYEDIQKLQGSEARKNSEKNILVNDLGASYEILKRARDTDAKKERRVDIVLDNAGFELYVDLILAGYLLSAGLATTVVLHPKSIPWFVSDVLPADFAALLSNLANPKPFYETPDDDEKIQGVTPNPLTSAEQEDLAFLFGEFGRMHAEGQLVLRPNRFWTHAGSFWRLPAEATDLFGDLKSSEIVIFKGDLNYRKLTRDAAWDPTTPFTEAIGPLGPGSGLNILALRTCKADVVVGLQPGQDERLRVETGGDVGNGKREWAWSGKWAVVSLSEGK